MWSVLAGSVWLRMRRAADCEVRTRRQSRRNRSSFGLCLLLSLTEYDWTTVHLPHSLVGGKVTRTEPCGRVFLECFNTKSSWSLLGGESSWRRTSNTETVYTRTRGNAAHFKHLNIHFRCVLHNVSFRKREMWEPVASCRYKASCAFNRNNIKIIPCRCLWISYLWLILLSKCYYLRSAPEPFPDI